MTHYQHTQFASAIVYTLIIAVLSACGMAFLSPILRLSLVVAIPLALTAWMFWKLTITVDDTKLRAAFGPGFVYKQVALADVESCEPVRTKWWEGIGIHLSRFGWLYNVSGGDAVAIKLRSGKRFAIGTDQPAELVDAIRRFASAR
ncbi:MAG: hypothetical protein M3Z64_03440 [Verrucomicrobiota bacterium]|nr:hypothetical protein [Verrucomicrobiota bacterium]